MLLRATIQSQKRLLTSLHVQVAIHSLSLSVLLTVLTSSLQSSVHVTLRVSSFLLHWHSTFSLRSRNSFLVSQSFSTVLLQFQRSMLRSSTSTVVSCLTLLVFLRISFVRLLRALFARSTSTQTLVWLTLLVYVRLWLSTQTTSTHVSMVR